MDNPCRVYAVNKDRPGSKVTAETATALVASVDYLLADGLRLQLPLDPGAADQRRHGPLDVVELGVGLGWRVRGAFEHRVRPVVVATHGEERLPARRLLVVIVFIFRVAGRGNYLAIVRRGGIAPNERRS